MQKREPRLLSAFREICASRIEKGKLGGGMFLWNLEQFKAMKKRLEEPTNEAH